MEPSTRTLAPITSTNEAKASMSTASSTASRTSDSPSKSPLWRLPPDVLTNLQPSYWTRRSSHGPPDGGPAGAVPPAGFVLGWSSGKAERDPLIVPGKRQTGVLEELLCRQIARLPPIEDRLGDIRRQIAEADEPHEIGAATPSRWARAANGTPSPSASVALNRRALSSGVIFAFEVTAPTDLCPRSLLDALPL